MFNVQIKHQFLDTEIALTLHFCMRSWHELVLLSPAVITYKGKLYSDSKKYVFYRAKCKVIHLRKTIQVLFAGGRLFEGK